ncbi:MAG TPA: tetratricopeptide repeat protein, partial [Thermosynechococcaceae cyanobacterium]
AGNWAEVFERVREALQGEIGKPMTHSNLDCERDTPGFLLAPLKKGKTQPRIEVPLFSSEAVSREAARNATQNAEAAIALSHQATQLLRQGDLEAAVLGYRQAIELQPEYAMAHSNLGLALKDLGQPEAAIPYFQQAIQLEPNSAEARNGYGCTLIDCGRVQAAIEQFERAIDLNPNHADAHLNLGMALLLLGNFGRGFAEYGWRWRNKIDLSLPYPEALWDGSDLRGKTILLTAEQGFGDTIQFVRYAPLVKQRGGRVVLACQKSLMRLLQNVPGVDQCIDRATQSTQTHAHAPLLELPRILGTTLATIPPAPRLLISSNLSIPPSPHLKIGIAWSTSPTSGTFARRSCHLSQFLSLLDLPVALYSLQKQPSEADRALLQAKGIFDLDPYLQDFVDTAAAIAQLDLVISVDTAVAHLAGTVGKPVWTLLPFAPDWRWLLHRADSPWYPTIRLFRQAKAGDWAGVFAEIRSALVARLDQTLESTIAPLPCLIDGSLKLKQCRHGVLLFRPDGLEGRSLMLYGEWQEGSLNLLRHFLRSKDTIVEVGAGVGVHTLFLAQSVGSEGKVWALEPDRLTFQTLCANLMLNSVAQVHTHSSAAEHPIDSFHLSVCRLLFVKETVLLTLKGGLQTIQHCQPVLYLAAPTDGTGAIVALLKPLGYDFYWHRVPWFNPENFDRNPQNELGSLTTDYLFGLPHSLGLTVNGMERVS